MTSHQHMRPNCQRSSTRYSQLPPSPALAPFVACYWTITGDAHHPATKIRVLPDGCMDAIIDLTGGLAPLGVAPLQEAHASAFVVGISNSPAIVALPTSPRVIGIRFRPGGATPLLDATACELAEGHADLDSLMPGFSQLMISHAGETTSPESMARIADKLLLERLSKARQADPMAAHAVTNLWHHMEHITINGLVQRMGVNHKRLERTMLRHVGMTPKRLGRAMRFVAAIRQLHATPRVPLVQLAHSLGYTDQAHFTREFKSFSGLTPTRWQAEQSDVDFLQYTPVPLA